MCQGNSASDHANDLFSDRQMRLLRHQGGIVVGLGDPIVDALVFAEDEQLYELGYEIGGCIPVDSYDDIQELLATFPEETRTPGGSAANVIRGLAGFDHVGFKCAFIGKVGTDAAGAQYACGLEERGVASLLHQSDTSTPTGICISLVSPDGQRTMRPYLGAASEMCKDDLPTEVLAQATLLHIEGYALFKHDCALAAVKAARAAGAKVSMDLSSFELCKAKYNEIMDFLPMVDLVFMNEDEAVAMVQLCDEGKKAGDCSRDVQVQRALEIFSQLCEVVVVSRGKKGCCFKGTGDEAGSEPAYKVQVVDTTGAGDTFVSGFLSAHLQGQPLAICAKRACFMGAQAVQIIGAELSESDWQYINEKLVKKGI